MDDYGTNINTNDYQCRRPVYYTNPLNQDREDVIIRMILTESNFNFSLARTDLGDLRVAEKENGINILRMWVAFRHPTKGYATILFKLPKLMASQTVTLWAFFGNSSATLVNEPDKMGFIFYETFKTTPLNSSKWASGINNSVTSYGYLVGTYLGSNDPNGYIYTVGTPLANVPSWIMEAGTYLDDEVTYAYSYTEAYSHAYTFTGENYFYIQYYMGGQAGNLQDGILHNAITGASTLIVSTLESPEGFSYQEDFIAYDEIQDVVYQRSLDRNTYPDTLNTFYRKVEGDTRLSRIYIYGAYRPQWYSAWPTYFSWLAIRPFDVNYRVLIDCSELTNVSLSDRLIIQLSLGNDNEYFDDITSVLHHHESSFGGDPLLLSDDSTNTVWVSDANATLESEISLTICFGLATNLTNSEYTHYDSSHVKYFGASKLSDTNEDVWGRDFWDCPTSTNSWAAIKFDSLCVINSCSITAVSEDLNCCPKNYVFFGSNYNPVTAMYKAVELHSGTFSKIATSQQFFFNNKAEYRYYILYVLDNYGGSNIRIQEWEMFYLPEKSTKKRVSQLRILPPTDELLYSFPNEISLQASVDMLTWDTLIPWTQTYSPWMQHYVMYGYWQHYSFEDPTEKGYYVYRLLCRGNWGEAGGRIAIKEWEMRELYKEHETYRILEGTTNIISQIWASENCGIDDPSGVIYATNDKLNYIMNDSVSSTSLPSNYNDINVIQGV